MAIIAIFNVKGGTAAKYNETIRRLAKMGLRKPKGQMYHVCYGDKRRLQVIDVFENQARLKAFGKRLAPLLKELGITARPKVFRVHNIIK
jgi:hypothetical protein